jgi:hypothetical protein
MTMDRAFPKQKNVMMAVVVLLNGSSSVTE